MLLPIAEVQKELKLSEDQKRQIETLTAEVREKAMASFGGINFQELQNLSQDEREKRMGEVRKKIEAISKEVDEKISKTLDDKQLERLKQLQLQRDGAMALNRPEVIKKLGLSNEQQAKIKKIQEDARPKDFPRFDRNQSSEDRRAAIQKMREQSDKVQKDVFGVLTDDQMLEWTEMCGKPFKFPAGGFGPGGPGAARP
jgi:hypothetical protein